MRANLLSRHPVAYAGAGPGALAYLCLGANMGDRAFALHQAVKLLAAADVRVCATSAIYETPPWGPVPQGAYLNQVVEVETTLPPHRLLRLTQRVERLLGRDRAREVRYGPRPIDIDILLLGDHQSRDDRLELPHPRILERAFVLVPLVEIAPDIIIRGRRAASVLSALDISGIHRITQD